MTCETAIRTLKQYIDSNRPFFCNFYGDIKHCNITGHGEEWRSEVIIHANYSKHCNEPIDGYMLSFSLFEQLPTRIVPILEVQAFSNDCDSSYPDSFEPEFADKFDILAPTLEEMIAKLSDALTKFEFTGKFHDSAMTAALPLLKNVYQLRTMWEQDNSILYWK